MARLALPVRVEDQVHEVKTKRIAPDYAAQILKKMILETWVVDEMARFIDYYRQTDRAATILRWLSKPGDEIDTKLREFLRPLVTPIPMPAPDAASAAAPGLASSITL